MNNTFITDTKNCLKFVVQCNSIPNFVLPGKNFSPLKNVETGSGAHPASYSTDSTVPSQE